MINKGFEDNKQNIETPNDINVTEKPLNSQKNSSGRVDINILKSKLEAEESKEFRKNIFIKYIRSAKVNNLSLLVVVSICSEKIFT